MEVTKKNLKKVEAGKKGYQARLLKLKEEILSGTTAGSTATTPGTNSGTTGITTATTAGTTGTTPATSTRSIDIYMYAVGSLAILAVGLCIFLYEGTEAYTGCAAI